MIPPKGDENCHLRIEKPRTLRFDNDSPERGREHTCSAPSLCASGFDNDSPEKGREHRSFITCVHADFRFDNDSPERGREPIAHSQLSLIGNML